MNATVSPSALYNKGLKDRFKSNKEKLQWLNENIPEILKNKIEKENKRIKKMCGLCQYFKPRKHYVKSGFSFPKNIKKLSIEKNCTKLYNFIKNTYGICTKEIEPDFNNDVVLTPLSSTPTKCLSSKVSSNCFTPVHNINSSHLTSD